MSEWEDQENALKLDEKSEDLVVSITIAMNVTISGVLPWYCGPPHQIIHNLSIPVHVKAYLTFSLIHRIEVEVHLDET